MENKKIDEVHKLALDRYKKCCDMVSEMYDDASEDIEFALLAEQWPEDVKNMRQKDGRPCLTVNKLYAFVNQVDNDLRQGTPQIKVRPSDGGSDEATAEIINGIARNIYYKSNGEMAVDVASFYAVAGGIGFFRVVTDYVNSRSFDQEIKFLQVADPLTVIFPFGLCKEADFSDVPYCFITTKIPRDEFKAKYKDKADIDFDTPYPTGWSEGDDVQLAEYFYIEDEYKKIYMLQDGTVTDEKPNDGFEYQSRDVVEKRVKWCLLSGKEILEETDFIGDRIPVFPVTGKEVRSRDKQVFVSLVRHAKDPQRMYNFWTSAEAETIALAPIAPIVGAEGQFEGHEGEWALANKKSVPYLEYKPLTLNGVPVGAPQRQPNVQIPNAIVNARGEATDDIKATTGIYDASLGAKGNETSGRAIIARQREGDTANFHFSDNRAKALQSATKLIVNMIPQIYSGPRMVRILGDDMAEKVVAVNMAYGGQEEVYDLSAGEYDVIVDIGPAYATARIEAAENMLSLVKAVPGVGQVSADLIVSNLDFPNSDALADRLKRMVPPQLLSDDEKEKMGINQQQGPSPEEMAQIMNDFQAMQNENQELKMQLGQLVSDKDDKERDRQARLAETLIRADVDLRKAGMSAIPQMVPAVQSAINQPAE